MFYLSNEKVIPLKQLKLCNKFILFLIKETRGLQALHNVQVITYGGNMLERFTSPLKVKVFVTFFPTVRLLMSNRTVQIRSSIFSGSSSYSLISRTFWVKDRGPH